MKQNIDQSGEFGDGFDSPPHDYTDVYLIFLVVTVGMALMPVAFMFSKWLNT